MSNLRLSRGLIITLLTLLLIYLPASGAKAIMVQLSLEELACEADSVIIGTVVSSQSQWNNDRSAIYTTVIVAMENHLKGNPLPDRVTVIVPGGEVDGIIQIVSDTPFFEPGEEVILFLEELPQQILPRKSFQAKTHSVYGNFQGKKEIVNNKVDGIPVEEVEEIILQITAEDQTDHDLFDEPNEPVLVSNHQYVPLGIRWSGASPIVSFKVNAPGEYSSHIQAAAATWSNAGANFSFNYSGPHSRNGAASLNQVNEIMWADLGTTSALALATIWCSGTTIIETDMVMNTRFNWTTNPFSYHDVQTVALHEFGHWIGLNHSADYNSIMYYQYKGTQRQLSPDDVAGIQFIYGSTGTSITPLNDNFADRLVLTGLSGEASGSNYYATRETGEPLHAGIAGGASVWWEWTAPDTGTVIFDTFGSSFDTILAIYSGSSLQTLAEIAANDDADAMRTWQSKVEFIATSGTTYLIALDGWSGANGSIVLNWELNPDSVDEPSGQAGDDQESESEDDIGQENEGENGVPNLEADEPDSDQSTSPKEDQESQNDPDLETEGDSGDQQSDPEIITVPSSPLGPVSGYINTAYLYQTNPVSCPDGSAAQYQYDWGNSSYSSWLDTVEAVHYWTVIGSYPIRVRARSSNNNELVSEWSETLVVNIYNMPTPGSTSTPPPIYIPPADTVAPPAPVQDNTSPAGTPLSKEENKVAGDLTGDKKVNVNDVSIIARLVLGLLTLDEEETLRADINGDGIVDVRDTIILMRYVLGLIESLPGNRR
jgi:hypothetical protein